MAERLGKQKQEQVEQMQSSISDAWERLNTIWSKFGYDDEVLHRRQKAVVMHVTDLLKEMVQEADEKLTEQQQKLDGLMQEIMQLAADLSIDNVPELAAASGKALLDMEAVLLQIADGLRQRKAIRMEKYNNINEKVIEISSEFNEPPMKIEFNGIPADSQVAKLEQNLNQLRHEKSKRLGQFADFKTSISELFCLLEKNPRNELERLVSPTGDVITATNPVSTSGIKVLSQAVLQQLQEIKTKFEEQLESNKLEGEKYWQKIRELWSRLSVDEEVINAFSKVHKTISTDTWKDIYKPSVLKGLHKEWERLEEEKRRNMSLFITQVREELCNLWLSKCFMTNVDIRFTEANYVSITPFTIADFTSDLYTEELLEKHETEVEYWRSFVDRNKKIIDGVTKRGQMFAQYKLLDQKSDDPSRLANRGGALLKEEKERKMLEKAIPKLEAELKQICDVFEREFDEGNGMSKFLVYERTIHEMIEQDWEEFHEEKRLRKEAKKKPNEAGVTSNKTMMTTQLGNQGTRKRPATPSSAQRGGGITPVKRNKTQAMTPTPGKTVQSPFLHPSAVGPSSSRKGQNGIKTNSHKKIGQYFHPNMSSSQAASKKILRKSIGKLRSGSSLNSGSSFNSTSSFSNGFKCSFSQPNLQTSSLEQLNFSEVIRGNGPPILGVLQQKNDKTPKKKPNYEGGTFAQPAPRSMKKTPSHGMLTRQPSSGKIPLPTKLSGKEQIPPVEKKSSKASVVSPVASYSEFTDHLLCQSTLNSSAVVPVQNLNMPILSNIPASDAAALTPSKSGKAGMAFAPAKLPLSDNCF